MTAPGKPISKRFLAAWGTVLGMALVICAFSLASSAGRRDNPRARVEPGTTQLLDTVIWRDGNVINDSFGEENWNDPVPPDSEETYVLTADLSGLPSYTDPAISARSYSSAVFIFQDGALIYAMDAPEGTPVDGSHYNIARLQPGWEDATIQVVMETSHNYGQKTFYPLVVGERSRLVGETVGANAATLAMGLMITFLGFLWLGLTAAAPSPATRRVLISAAFLMLCVGTWIIGQNRSKQLLWANPMIPIDLSLFAMATLPLLLSRYIKWNYPLRDNPELGKLENFTFLSLVDYVLMVIAFDFFEVPFYHPLMLPLAASILIAYFVLLLVLVARAWARTRFEGGIYLIIGISLMLAYIIIEQVLMQLMPTTFQFLLTLPIAAPVFIFLLRAVSTCAGAYRPSGERRRILTLAYTDSLTGVLNRKALENRLSRMDSGRPCHIFLFDIDGMKECNDNYGHAAGDRLLKAFAQAMSHATSDLNRYIFRYGGDEFLLIVDDAVEIDPDALVAKVRDAFAEFTPIPGLSGVSAGWSRFDGRSRSEILQMLREADSRMYYDKLGRGRASTPPQTVREVDFEP